MLLYIHLILDSNFMSKILIIFLLNIFFLYSCWNEQRINTNLNIEKQIGNNKEQLGAVKTSIDINNEKVIETFYWLIEQKDLSNAYWLLYNPDISLKEFWKDFNIDTNRISMSNLHKIIDNKYSVNEIHFNIKTIISSKCISKVEIINWNKILFLSNCEYIREMIAPKMSLF